MSKLDDIPVRVETTRRRSPNIDIAMDILRDIASALSEFQVSGRPQIIDLRHKPRMNEATYGFLEQALSRGEVSATIEAELRAEIFETGFAGVWWLRHRNEQGEIVTEVIEVTAIPVLLKAHRVDMLGALKRLQQYLEASSATNMTAPTADPEQSAIHPLVHENQEGVLP